MTDERDVALLPGVNERNHIICVPSIEEAGLPVASNKTVEVRIPEGSERKDEIRVFDTFMSIMKHGEEEQRHRHPVVEILLVSVPLL